jgi:hypothetical protein
VCIWWTLQKGVRGRDQGYQNRRPLTCALTTAGREAFRRYVDLLAEIVRQARETEGVDTGPAYPSLRSCSSF